MEFDLKKQYYRPDEVADILNVTRRTVYRMILDGRLTGVRLDKRPRRIPQQAVLTLARIIMSERRSPEMIIP